MADSFPQEVSEEPDNQTVANPSSNEKKVLPYTHPPVTVFLVPARPPISGSLHKPRISRSASYNKATPEYFMRLTPTLPNLWIRDAHTVSVTVAHKWDRAWRRYGLLGIPGKGEGASLMARTRHGRRKLKDDYKKLDPDIRAAKEVALARFDPFCLRNDGTLDYLTDEGDGSACMVM